MRGDATAAVLLQLLYKQRIKKEKRKEKPLVDFDIGYKP